MCIEVYYRNYYIMEPLWAQVSMSKHANSLCKHYSDKFISRKETQEAVDKKVVGVVFYLEFFIKTKHKIKHRRPVPLVVRGVHITR